MSHNETRNDLSPRILAARGRFGHDRSADGTARRVGARAVAALALLLVVAPLAAQDVAISGGGEDRELVDRIAAVAGDSIILLTQIEEQLLRMQASGATLPESEAELRELRREVLESLVNQQLVLQAAARDSTIVVPPDQLQSLVEQNFQERVRSFGSEAALQRALVQQGMTLTSFRSQIEEEIRRQILMSRYFEKQRQGARNLPISEAAVRDFYEAQRHLLEQRPATVSFQQVVIQPVASDSARAAAREEAERILGLIRGGDDFVTLARRFSQDPGSRAEGGDLGWFRRGTMVREFEDVAFALPEGRVSDVVETPFGAHIIRVERIRGSERRVRHILLQAEVSEADVARARETAEGVRSRIEGGGSLNALRREFPTPPGTLPDSLDIAVDQVGQLPPPYAALATAEPGDVLGPLVIGPRGRQLVAVVWVRDVRDEGEFTFEDLRPQIERRLRDDRLEERVIRNLRERAYIDIRIE